MLDNAQSVPIFKKQLTNRYFNFNGAQLIFLNYNFFAWITKHEDRRSTTARTCNGVYNLSPSRSLAQVDKSLAAGSYFIVL